MTSANHATAYVWSSLPVAAEGMSPIWFVPRGRPGLTSPRAFDGLGLRGNDSAPVIAQDVVVPETHRLGEAGSGLQMMLEKAMPLFNMLLELYTAGLNEEVFDALILLTAGSWQPDALRAGWERMQTLQQDMDQGRQRHLVRLGFNEAEAAALSALHTRNFMQGVTKRCASHRNSI